MSIVSNGVDHQRLRVHGFGSTVLFPGLGTYQENLHQACFEEPPSQQQHRDCRGRVWLDEKGFKGSSCAVLGYSQFARNNASSVEPRHF